MSEESKAEVVQVKSEVVEVERQVIPPKRNSPKHSQSKWIQCRTSYERGDFKSVRELGERFGIKEFTLHSRINREGWKEKKEQLLAKVQSTLEKQVVKELTKQESYLVRLGQRANKYEAMLDASAENLGSKDANGVPLVDPDMLDTLSRSELRVVEMQRTALRIIPVSQVDHMSGGKDLGSSFVSAIAKLRESNTPKLGPSDLQAFKEAEIE